VGVVLRHAAPAEVELTPEAVHVRASTVLFDSHFAVRALSYISREEETPQSYHSIRTADAFVPWFLASKTSVSSALRAHESVFVALLSQRGLAVCIWAPNQVGV
jgi:hypothetical protein